MRGRSLRSAQRRARVRKMPGLRPLAHLTPHPGRPGARASGCAYTRVPPDINAPCRAVRVALRVRPMLPTDLADGASECVFTTPGEPMLFLGSDRAFTFDHVFGTRATQPEIYEQIRVGPMVRSALSGLNATVFAYGQTGSGKTHTMGTANIDLERSDETTGILPRAMRELFGAVTERLDAGESLKVRVSATFIEIHREEVHDLLHGLGVSERDGTGQAAADEFVPGGRPVTAPANGSAHSAGGSAAGSSGGGVTIREDPSGAIALAGARQRMLRSAADALRCVQQGALLRATASTAMNATSSRSHAVLTVTVETDLPPLGGQTGGKPRALSAKLHFVDLAGSERAKRTKAEGERLQVHPSARCWTFPLLFLLVGWDGSGSQSGFATAPLRPLARLEEATTAQLDTPAMRPPCPPCAGGYPHQPRAARSRQRDLRADCRAQGGRARARAVPRVQADAVRTRSAFLGA